MCKMIISNPHSDPLPKMTWFWRAGLLRPVSNRPALWFRSSTASYFNKCFFVNSPWHCASFTNDILWTILRHDLNQMHQSKHSFTPLILITDSNMWLCQKVTSVYCVQCRQDSGRDWNLYLLLTGRDTHIQRDTVWAWPTVRRRLLVDVLLWRRCLCKCLCPCDVIMHLRSKRAVFGAWLN